MIGLFIGSVLDEVFLVFSSLFSSSWRFLFFSLMYMIPSHCSVSII